MTDVPTTPRKAMSIGRRLRIYEKHKGICILCDQYIVGKKWIVEHVRPLGLGGADTDENCGPAHESCRRVKDKGDVADIARAKRRKARHLGIRRSSSPMPGSKASKWKKPFNGPAVLR